LTKAVKPKLETSTFWCLQVFSPNSLKKEAHSCLEKRGEGDTYPELLGRGEGEAEDWGKRGFPGSVHEGLLVATAAQVDPCLRAVLEHWREGVTFTLVPWEL
jgi:hypothetical protein